MTGTVLVLGASGGFGRNAARAFADAGWTLRRHDRKTGDMRTDAQGADVIVNALNPPGYRDWATNIPAITELVLAAARINGSTVIVPGNVYVYGDQAGPWDATTPHCPVSRKGAIRARMEAAYKRAADEGVRTIILRGGDFIDPENPATILNMVVLKGLAKGRITAMGDPDVPRAYAYLPDMARAAVALAERRETLPRFADIPFPGPVLSFNDMARAVQARTGAQPRIARFPWWLMTLAAPFWELARELREMRYLYETPHSLSGRTFDRLLPDFALTPPETVLRRQIAAMTPSGQVDVHPDKAVV